MSKEPKTKPVSSGISFKDSIKTKLILIMALVAAVPLLISVIISYSTSTSKAKDDALSLLNSQALTVESLYANVIDKNVAALQTMANSSSCVSFMETHGTPGQTVPDELIRSELNRINETINDGNTSVILVDATGQQVIRADGKEGTNVADRDYFTETVATGKPYVSNIIVGKTSGNRIVQITAPIRDESGSNIIGIIVRSYDLNNLHNFLADNVSDGYITDREGTLAAHAQFEISAEDEPINMGAEAYMNSAEYSGMFDASYSDNKTYVSWVREPISNFTVAVACQDKEIMSSAIRSALIVVVIGVVLMIIAIIISFIMAKSFTDPIKAVNQALSALSDGRFLKVEKFDSRKDEFGEISRDTNAVINKLDDIVSSIKLSAANVSSSSEELSDMANQISQTAEDVSNAVQGIASGASHQADEIQDATINVGLIGDAVGNVQSSSSDLSVLASKMKEASEISSRSLEDLQNSSNEMTQKIDEISKTIQSTQNAVNNISEKVEGITSIATQTNLLSLNASIEAARAGEAGRGFAVVAEEIGKLADDSKAMADAIRIEMAVLLEQAQAAVEAAEDVRTGNNDQQVALGETLAAVNGMLDDIGSTVGGVKLISEGADTCETSKNAVAETMSALSAISQENAASSEETGASMEQLSATVTTLAGSAGELKDISEKLNEEMKFFKS